MRAARAARWMLALLLGIGPVPPARAQLLPPPPTNGEAPAVPGLPSVVPPGQPATPAAVALPDIATSAEAASQRLRAIEAETAPDARVQAISDALPKRTQEIEDGVAAVDAAIQSRAGIDRLIDLERKLAGMREEIGAWQDQTRGRAELLEARVNELSSLKDTWDLTLEKAKGESAPAPVLDRIRDLRKDIRNVQGNLQDLRSTALTQQGEVARIATTIGLLVDNVSRARWEVRGRLFEADRPSIASAARKADGVGSVLSRVRESAQRDFESLRSFAQLSSDRIQIHAVLFALLLAAAFALRSWARQRRAADKLVGAAPMIYERPISVAMLGALFAIPWLYPHAPLILNGLSGVLVLVPTLRLLFEVFPRELRNLWYAIAGFYLLDRVRYGVQSVELLERSLFILEMLAASALAIWLLRAHRAELLDRVIGRPRLTRRVLQVMAAAFAVAAAADFTGYFTLGQVVGEGLLSSLYAGMVLYGAVAVVSPIVPALLGSQALASLHVVTRYRRVIESSLERAIDWSAFGGWLYISLDRMTIAEQILGVIRWVVVTPVTVGTVAISLGDVLAFAAIVAGAILLSRAVRVLLEEDVLPRTPLDRGIPHAIANTTAYVISFLGFLLALGAAGIDLSKVTVLAGAFGVGVGIGLQNIVNNFISGLILLYERPIQLGDTVEVGNLTGEVRRIGIRSSTLRTFQGAEVIVPNANLISQQVVNWTLSDRQRRIEVPIGVAYGNDPERVLAILIDVAKSSPEVLTEPPPLALFRGFGESSLNFELRAWTGLASYLEVQSRVAIAVNAALAEAGIEIPFPHREIRIKRG